MPHARRLVRDLTTLLVIAAGLSAPCATAQTVARARAGRPRVEIVNNQPFDIQMPVSVPLRGAAGGPWRTGEGVVAQPDGDEAVFVARVPAASSRTYTLDPGGGGREAAPFLTVSPAAEGVELSFGGRSLGRLSWGVTVREAAAASGGTRRRGAAAPAKEDPAAEFAALPLAFTRTVRGDVFDLWGAAAEKGGLRLSIELRAYHDGFLDVSARAENLSAPTKNVYAAVVCRWQQPRVESRTLNYNNEAAAFADGGLTPFRGADDSGSGEYRHMFIQRGVDWVNTRLAGAGVVWLNDFAPSFTVHQEATDKRPGRWTGANSPQLTREAQAAAGGFYAVTELAHPMTRYYQERFVPNVLPPAGESLTFASRLVFGARPFSDEDADRQFIAYAGYAEREASPAGARLSLGVPGVSFGTNYFPYSTLGENFTLLKLPGMDRAAYWPLAADTVTRWRLFADDIRRDLSIAKAMGFELIRLHHLELITPLDAKVKGEYLDFLFAELRRLKLRALLDAQMRPEEIAAIAGRYRDAVRGVEIENEVLIFGINDGREKYFNEVYDAVKRVAPEMPVHLTGHTNAGVVERLARLGVRFDRVGQHAYMDSVPAIPSARGYALALANYGKKVGKPSVITEWNWRGLTRLTPEARARLYAPIFENVLKTRSVPEVYQFQFNESLAMDPLTLKGIRHYEPLWLSRRPKPEAFELARLIRDYSLPSNPVRALDVPYAATELDKGGAGVIRFRVTNTTGRALTLRASLEMPSNLKAQLRGPRGAIRLAPRASADVTVDLAALPTADDQRAPSAGAKPLPGFYQVFLRLEGEGGLLRYGWGEARLAGAPRLDTTPDAVPGSGVRYGAGALAFDLDRPLAVVYGDGAPVQDVETAYALVNALESATGRPVHIYTLGDTPPEVLRSGALVLVGTAKTNRLVGEAAAELPAELSASARYVAALPAGTNRGARLITAGATPEDAERAAMDLLIRFWKHAKDSAARRVGLVAKEVPQGGDPALLP